MPQSKATIVFEWIGKYVVPFVTAALVGLMVFALNTLSRIDTSLGTLNEATATLKTDLREIRSDIKDIRKDVSDLRDRVGKLEAAVDLHGRQLFRLERARAITFETELTGKDIVKDSGKDVVIFERSLPIAIDDPAYARATVRLNLRALDEMIPPGWYVVTAITPKSQLRVTLHTTGASTVLKLLGKNMTITADVVLSVPEK